MIRPAAFRTIWKQFCVYFRFTIVVILGMSLLWWKGYVEDVVSVFQSSLNVYVFATPALSWLLYRERNSNASGTRMARTKANNCRNNEAQYRYLSRSNDCDRITNGRDCGLPDDILINVCSFLHPLDVTSFACVNKSSLELVDGRKCIRVTDETHYGNHHIDCVYDRVRLKGKKRRLELKAAENRITSNNLWKTLWYRDYGHVLLDWHVGRKALRRSLQQPSIEIASLDPAIMQNTYTVLNRHNVCHTNEEVVDNEGYSLSVLLAKKLDVLTDMKYFYFSFLETYQDYVLAGQNTTECCLLGLHGHIFDFTTFADYHPGLSEPIRLECGKDATEYFEDLPHSHVARKIARRLCILVDRACLMHKPSNHDRADQKHVKEQKVAGCGLHRLPGVQWSAENSNTRPPSPSPLGANKTAFELGIVIPETSFTEKKRANSLRRIRNLLDQEQRNMKFIVSAKATAGYLYTSFFTRNGPRTDSNHDSDQFYSDMHPDGHMHVYYDPFDQRWKSWYTRHSDFKPTFCEIRTFLGTSDRSITMQRGRLITEAALQMVLDRAYTS